MSLPSSNTTCDIYHAGSPAPPADPDVAAVPIYYASHADNIKPASTPGGNYTHIFHVDLGVDIRDSDRVYVPDKSGTPFNVSFVARTGVNTAVDQKLVYVQRDTSG